MQGSLLKTVRVCGVCVHVCVGVDARDSEEDDKSPPLSLCLTV